MEPACDEITMILPPAAIFPWLYAAEETRSGPSAQTSIILSWIGLGLRARARARRIGLGEGEGEGEGKGEG